MSEKLTSSAHACLNLVHNHEHVVLGAESSDLFEIAILRNDDATFALNRLKHDSNDVGVGFKLLCEGRNIVILNEREAWGERSESVGSFRIIAGA